MAGLAPFLMFTGQAREAMAFYMEVFPDSAIVSAAYYGDEAGENAGKVLHARMRIYGQQVHFIDSPEPHAFGFTPSISLYVDCPTKELVDRLYAALVAGGETLMPLDAYPFNDRYGWVEDRFGVSWQLGLTPNKLGT